ncbi:zinc-binding dehydrogenase [Nocardia xishanensis]|uniref:Zinc-binding dehydrogenase n=1 Tax=Nocardia xishanensis TaxID=238964 RepID=A0ABW7X7E5_9NOCA
MEKPVKAVMVKAFGGPEALAVVDFPDPHPAAGQVSITTEAIGVGGIDALIRSGALAAYGATPGRILGSEVAGTVTEVGEGVDSTWVGRRVWALTGESGGYAEQALASAETLVPLPADLSAVAAVTLGSSAMVAHFALRHAHFGHGESVLVRGAAGGIGVMAVQIAARDGAGAVAVTTSSAERGDRLRELGATHVLDRLGHGALDAPAGYGVILDIVAGAGLPSFFARLEPNGRMVAVGAMAGMPPADFGMEMVAAFRKSMSFATFSADTVPALERRAVTAEMFAAASRGELKAVVHEVLPLEQAVLAHQKMEGGEVFGRIALTPSRSWTTSLLTRQTTHAHAARRPHDTTAPTVAFRPDLGVVVHPSGIRH